MTLPAHITNSFLNPPREFSLLPFWFWNDTLSDDELRRQIADFEAHGVYGFVIHPRIGLPRDCGWMSENMLRFMRVALEEAARRGMQVVLYDEGMYPSGSSSGQVVAHNPTFACRGLARVPISAGGEYSPLPGHNLLSCYERGGERFAIVDRPVRSVIRGLHYINEQPDGAVAGEEEPPAADILNPDSVACFMRLVYDRFYQEFKEYFGRTIIGIFTDEPGLLGRHRETERIWPGTSGILQHVNRLLGYDFTPHLPALWCDEEPNAKHWQREYSRAVQLRLEETYYQPLHHWCEQHGVALMGHPAAPDAIGQEKYFHIPGQDIVWRYIEPDKPSALEGEQSTQAKCTSSAMLHQGRRRNSNECYGAYGHELTFEEMKWLADWLLVRGVNLLIPHAFYYSLCGPRRDERPPDVGPNNLWWSDYQRFADYCRRLCWLNTDSRHICNIAVLAEADFLPWRAAKILFEHQRDFNYLELRDLWESAEIYKNGVRIAGMHYQAVIWDGLKTVPEAAKPLLKVLSESGRLLHFDPQQSQTEFLAALSQAAAHDVTIKPVQPELHLRDLRLRHVVKGGVHWYLLFNEGPDVLEFEFEPANIEGRLHLFDAWTGEVHDWSQTTCVLAPRQTLIVCAVN